MALTNYLMQTVVAIAIFYGVGLRFMGRVGAVWWLPIAVAVLAVQAAISRWWLERYEFGPFEWIWRQITYGRRLPLVRTSRTRV
jgi:uncharacterized protein